MPIQPERRSLVSGCAVICAAAGGVLLFFMFLNVFGLPSLRMGGQALLGLLLLALAGLCVALLLRAGYGWQVCALALLPIGAAFFLRALCLDYRSYDYLDFLSQWAAFFRENGGFAALKEPVGNYNVPYLYFLAAISYLPLPDLYLIKLFSLVFDVLLAWGVLRLCRVFSAEGSPRPVVAFCLALLLPTVILNGAYWGQCDAIYVALLIHALASVLSGRAKSSMVLLAVAFSFKLQAIFLLPLWLALWFTKRVKFSELWFFPLTYLFTILPALALGKPLGDILGVYLGQLGEYSALTLNAPSIFALLPYGARVNESLLSVLGIALAGLLVAALMLLLFSRRKWVDTQILFTSAVLLAIGIPFFLPHMHDRYFFLADLLVLAWVCLDRRRIPQAVLIQAASLSAYSTYLQLRYTLPLRIGPYLAVMGLEALAVLTALALTAAALLRQFSAARQSPASS